MVLVAKVMGKSSKSVVLVMKRYVKSRRFMTEFIKHVLLVPVLKLWILKM